MPKRMRRTFSSRGVSVASTLRVCSARFIEITASDGEMIALVLDEVAEVRIFLFADRRLERDRLLGDLEDLADLVERQLHLLGDLFRRRLAAELLDEIDATCG